MKHSELKQIIKEEIRNVLKEESDYDDPYKTAKKNLAAKADIKLYKPEGRNKFREIFLPKIDGSPSRIRIDNILKYKAYLQDFRKEYNEEPQFDKSIPDRWMINNPKYLENKKIYDDAYSDYGTKGD